MACRPPSGCGSSRSSCSGGPFPSSISRFDPERWGEYAGVYSDPLAPEGDLQDIEVTWDEVTSELSVSIDGGDALELLAEGPEDGDYLDLFMLEPAAGGESYIRFWRDAGGLVDLLQPNPQWSPTVFHRVE